MTIRVDESGARYSDANCLQCDAPGPHWVEAPGATIYCYQCKGPIGENDTDTG